MRLHAVALALLLPPPSALCARLAVILLDGFRWDYADRMAAEEIPNLKWFVSGGVRAEYVQPIFPSSSFPSWTTIVTGKDFLMFKQHTHKKKISTLYSSKACTRASTASCPTTCTTARGTGAFTCSTSTRRRTRPGTQPGGPDTCLSGSQPPRKVRGDFFFFNYYFCATLWGDFWCQFLGAICVAIS